MDKNSDVDDSSQQCNDDNGEQSKMDRMKTAVQEQMARFRPPFTPSNSLLQSPPAIKVTRPSVSNPLQLEAPPEEQEESPASSSATTAMPRPHHQPQPFPLPLRRRSSTASNPGHSPPSTRHSMPRLSITSLGSAAKTFRTLAAFIVPEEQSQKERHRELRRASQRRASLAAVRKEGQMANGRGDMKQEPLVEETQRKSSQKSSNNNNNSIVKLKLKQVPHKLENNKSTQMRSSSARPMPRTTASAGQNAHSNRPTPLPRQNGGAPRNPPSSRDLSRSRSAAGQHLQNGSSRAPSMPATPRIINKRYAHVKSKVNSITDYSPAPSGIKIFHQPIKVSAASKVGSLQNAAHVPAGGNVKIENRKLNFRETAKPRVEAKSELPIPKSEVKIPTQKLVWKADAKVGSLENAAHKPGGGQLKIFNEPVKVKADSKVGSLDNIGHVPGGGNVKISDYSRSISGTGSVHSTSRRDTADSGSSIASAKKQQQKPRPPANSAKGKEENGMAGVEGAHRPVEMVITPRELNNGEERRQRDTNGTMEAIHDENHFGNSAGVAEGELINF